ncbi:hypothetical protein RUM44_009081 [Polyplax serrata]|uniref:Uncharacterized protein n=1 Tax=Polyplax serrata TaxID=468196 RepID=A0ABR1ARN9_POLSC
MKVDELGFNDIGNDLKGHEVQAWRRAGSIKGPCPVVVDNAKSSLVGYCVKLKNPQTPYRVLVEYRIQYKSGNVRSTSLKALILSGVEPVNVNLIVPENLNGSNSPTTLKLQNNLFHDSV